VKEVGTSASSLFTSRKCTCKRTAKGRGVYGGSNLTIRGGFHFGKRPGQKDNDDRQPMYMNGPLVGEKREYLVCKTSTNRWGTAVAGGAGGLVVPHGLGPKMGGNEAEKLHTLTYDSLIWENRWGKQKSEPGGRAGLHGWVGPEIFGRVEIITRLKGINQ